MAKILLAEDEEFISRMINLRLTLKGHEVDHAKNGQEAVDKALTGKYDLILMDMHMPVMDGHEATHTLREKGYQGLIVAVTASVMSADSEKAIKSGCDEYIAKPIGADFEERLESLLSQK
ncbi:MAG: response regulator [Gammaproteobacteria bacterium]|nr:response regulator [Gammaproteobacteria bacterium]